MSATTSQREPSGPKDSHEGRDALDDTFSIDTRALAVVRIALAALLLIQAILEWSRPRDPSGPFEFIAEYGDVIVVPFAVMMFVGYRTTFAVILCWLAYSFRIRGDLLSPEVSVSIGDLILCLGLFWCMFLPLGRHLSLDSRGMDWRPVRYLSVASSGLLLQIFVIYFSSGLLKSIDEWVVEATAMETILAHSNYETSLGTAMLNYPTALVVMSVATVVLEVVGSVLVILPGKSLSVRRLIVVPMFIALHIGIAALMGLELFPYVLIAIWLVYLPSRLWDRVWAWFGGVAGSVAMTDDNKWRNTLAAMALLIVAVSNVITWMYFPDVEGTAKEFQTVATYMVLYQQWAMFSVPSSLP